MNRRLQARRALVTGGTRGIGVAIATRLAADNVRVTVTGTAKDGAAPEGCEYRQLDLADDASVDALVAELPDWQLDVLVNNAGVNKISPFTEIDAADWDRIQRINVRGPMLLCRAVVGGMRDRGWGRIVNVSSIFGTVSMEQRASYSTSKFALDGMTAALAAEVARHGVLVNCVAPGFIDTDLTRAVLGEEGIARLTAQVPARRLGRPDEVAALVAWLCGEENTYVSGQNVVIDGGFTRV